MTLFDDMNDAERKAWIGWEPTPAHAMPDCEKREHIAAELAAQSETRRDRNKGARKPKPLPDTLTRRRKKQLERASGYLLSRR